jgi:hypothetical protein
MQKGSLAIIRFMEASTGISLQCPSYLSFDEFLVVSSFRRSLEQKHG